MGPNKAQKPKQNMYAIYSYTISLSPITCSHRPSYIHEGQCSVLLKFWAAMLFEVSFWYPLAQ